MFLKITIISAMIYDSSERLNTTHSELGKMVNDLRFEYVKVEIMIIEYNKSHTSIILNESLIEQETSPPININQP